MNALQTLTSSIKSTPKVWQRAIGAGCVITAVALASFGLHQIQFTSFSAHFSYYNTFVSLDLWKTVAILGGAGASAGIGAYLLKRAAFHTSHTQEKSKIEKTRINKRIVAKRLLALTALVGGTVLMLLALYHFSNMPQQNLLHMAHATYLANTKMFKLNLAALTVGSFLLTWGMIETARHISK